MGSTRGQNQRHALLAGWMIQNLYLYARPVNDTFYHRPPSFPRDSGLFTGRVLIQNLRSQPLVDGSSLYTFPPACFTFSMNSSMVAPACITTIGLTSGVDVSHATAPALICSTDHGLL